MQGASMSRVTKQAAFSSLLAQREEIGNCQERLESEDGMSKVGHAPKSLLGMVVETQPWGGPSSYLPRPCKATIESFRAMALSFVDVVVAIAKFVSAQ